MQLKGAARGLEEFAAAPPEPAGEWFPVKRQLLRPCIALTSAVRAEDPAAGGPPPQAAIDVDCLTFDRWAGMHGPHTLLL